MGIIFRVYMSSNVGAEGIGLYQLICSVYLFSASFSASGISLAVTRLVTEAIAKNSNKRSQLQEAKAALRRCLIIGIFIGTLTGLCLFYGADFFSNNILMEKRACLPLKFLAPSLPFLAFSACFRGYFYALRQIMQTATEQLIEQVIEILVFAMLIKSMAPNGLEYACCAIVIGTTVAEALSCVYSYVLYRFSIKKWQNEDETTQIQKNQPNKYPTMMKQIWLISLPITASACLRSSLSTLENILIPTGLRKYGASVTKSLADYGMITGMVMPVISFPSVLVTSCSALLIPEISEANAADRKKNIKHVSTKIIQLTLLFSIFVMGVFLAYSKLLGKWVYSSETAGMYIFIFAPLVPLVYVGTIIDGILKGFGQQLYYLSYNVAISIIRVVLIHFLIPHKGVNGLIMIIFLSEILDAFFSLHRLIKLTKLTINKLEYIIKPIVCIAIACSTAKQIINSIHIANLTLQVTASLLLTLILYLMPLKLLKSSSER